MECHQLLTTAVDNANVDKIDVSLSVSGLRVESTIIINSA